MARVHIRELHEVPCGGFRYNARALATVEVGPNHISVRQLVEVEPGRQIPGESLIGRSNHKNKQKLQSKSQVYIYDLSQSASLVNRLIEGKQFELKGCKLSFLHPNLEFGISKITGAARFESDGKPEAITQRLSRPWPSLMFGETKIQHLIL